MAARSGLVASAIILAIVLTHSAGDPGKAIAVAATMAIVSGLVCILAGVLKFGFITELLSKPIRYGYMNGIAFTVLISQLPKLLGFKIEADGPLRALASIGQEIAKGSINWTACLVGVGTLAVILLLKGSRLLPGVLIAVVISTVVVGVFDLSATAGVAVLGSLPSGLPGFAIPLIDLADLEAVIVGGFAVALVSFADTSVLSRVYAARTRQPVDPNQEMVGLGVANLAAGFFQGFPISSSSSRTPVAEAAGARTQLTGVVGAVTVAAHYPGDGGARPAEAPAVPRAGRGRHRLGDRAVRDLRPEAHLAHPALGILAVDAVLRRCRGPGRDPWHRPRHRGRGDRVPVGRMASALRRTRPA